MGTFISRSARIVWTSILPWQKFLSCFTWVLLLNVIAAVAQTDSSDPGPTPVTLNLQFSPEQTLLRLRGKGAGQQLLVTAKFASGAVRDWTRNVAYESAPPGIVTVNSNGLARGQSDGAATIRAIGTGGLAASLAVQVEQSARFAAINFPNQVVPVFTKLGCNAGGCHGKASGQNGFKLSLLGFEPTEDYEHLVKESRGRRLFPAAPDRSLLLLKATGTLPHGGGTRIGLESDDYQLLLRWISDGMPYGQASDPVLSRIEVFPKERILPFYGQQQLIVLGHYSDGSIEDVTGSALFEPNDKDMAKVDPSGLVTVFNQPGDVAVMVRYQGHVAVFRATLPLGAPLAELPEPRNFVDDLVFAKWKAMGLPPSGECDDATFVRRSALDIAGRLPSPSEVQRVVKSEDPSKRDRWIDELLASEGYASLFATKWSALLRNRRNTPTHARGNYLFYDWIWESFRENKPYDQFVRELLTASGDMAENPPVAWYRQLKDPQTQLEDTAQLFLGMRMQCAQCHHHPFEKWSQQDYFGLAAFFSTIGRKPGTQPGEEMIFVKRAIPSAVNKKTKQPVRPAGLGGAVVAVDPDVDPRGLLADWLTDPKNPYFARALVNRYWKHFFNRGLVDPEDDLRETNPPSNPALLDALAENFARHGYDLKWLVRTLCQSHTYQQSALPNAWNRADKQNFSRFYPKRLPAEVLLDAVDLVTGRPTKFEGMPVGTRATTLPDNSFNTSSYFLTVFGRPESSSACECERSQDASLSQSLHLVNAKDIQEKLGADTGRAALLAKDRSRTDREKVIELFLLAYGREPASAELRTTELYLYQHSGDKIEGSKNRQRALEDLIWAIINSKEFLFNH